MQKTRVLCVLSTLLGNKATTERLIEVLSRIPDVEPIPVLVEAQDYGTAFAPWWAKALNPFEFQYIARRKSLPYLAQPFDMLLVNSWESVTAFRKVARSVPAAALIDAVPATVNRQIRGRGNRGWKRSLAHAVHSSLFARAVSQFDYLMPMGSDCADSLVTKYRCDPDRCCVILAPQDLDLWQPGPRTHSAPLRLLFVGNDFDRKGGEFLLRLYSTCLSSSCRLVIASNDPALSERTFPEGVSLLRGRTREQLIETYRESDVFILPSRQDFMPQVLAEALAMGLPCIANDVGGIRDLVRTGETGALMSRADPPQLWAARIQEWASNPAELARLSRGARRFAEENLGLPHFEQLIAHVISCMKSVHKPR